MNILLIGSGGREHALARAIAASPLCTALLVAPGNPGTARLGRNVALDIADHAAIVALCREEHVGLVVIGPETPLVAGLVDDLAALGIRAFGPSRLAARLEGSKSFTKAFCAEYGIPTAAFARFTDADAAKRYVEGMAGSAVVKADGLAAGKGVVVAETMAEAEAAIDDMLGGALGEAGREIVIEERLYGEEASVFALCDGDTALPFGTAGDHKRALDGDRGPNTGGMGAYSPAAIVTPALEAQIMDTIIRPTLSAMNARGTPFVGILYAGLMLTAEGPHLIEYNVRFGDPEAQALLPRLRSDLVETMLAAIDGTLGRIALSWSDEVALSVVLAAPGYPGPVETGSVIGGLAMAEAQPGILVFQAGTAEREGVLSAQGGRVLAVTAAAPTFAAAKARAYAAVRLIDWPDGFHRTDIGDRAIRREEDSHAG